MPLGRRSGRLSFAKLYLISNLILDYILSRGKIKQEPINLFMLLLVRTKALENVTKNIFLGTRSRVYVIVKIFLKQLDDILNSNF